MSQSPAPRESRETLARHLESYAGFAETHPGQRADLLRAARIVRDEPGRCAPLLVPGLLTAAWWAAARENILARGADDMPGGWHEIYDHLETIAYAALKTAPGAPPHFAQPNGEVAARSVPAPAEAGDGGVT